MSEWALLVVSRRLVFEPLAQKARPSARRAVPRQAFARRSCAQVELLSEAWAAAQVGTQVLPRAPERQ
jgi:hypothetical protein